MDPFSQLRDEFVKAILKIESPFYSNAITALIFLAFLLFLIYAIRIIIRDRKEEKERKQEKLDREREWLKFLKEDK